MPSPFCCGGVMKRKSNGVGVVEEGEDEQGEGEKEEGVCVY